VPSIRALLANNFSIHEYIDVDANIPKSIPITGPSTFVSVSDVEELNLAKADIGGLTAFRRSVGLNAAVVRGIYMRQTMVSVSSHHCCREKKRKRKKL